MVSIEATILGTKVGRTTSLSSDSSLGPRLEGFRSDEFLKAVDQEHSEAILDQEELEKTYQKIEKNKGKNKKIGRGIDKPLEAPKNRKKIRRFKRKVRILT